MTPSQLRWILWVSLVLACLCGCSPQSCSGRQSQSVAPSGAVGGATLTTSSESGELYGGTPRAWITPAGDAPDSNFCAADLRLPLETEPAWVYEYGYEFSAAPPSDVVHRDGLLVVTANCPQLLGLNARTGEQVFNQDVYQHQDTGRLEDLGHLFVHPAEPIIAGQDDLKRHYVWDINAEGLQERWVGPELSSRSGSVVFGNSVYTAWGESVYCLSLDTGQPRWSYPNLVGAGGIVLGLDGVLVWWSQANNFIALDAVDGSLLWSYMHGVRIEGTGEGAQVIIDDEHHRAYLMLADEWIQCRDLTTGAMLWEHNWSDIVRPDRRQAFEEFMQTPGFPMPAVQGIISPEGLVLPVHSGCVLALDHDGERRWVYYSSTAVTKAIGFRNAVLIAETYVGRDVAAYGQWLQGFCPEPPDWSNYLQVPEERRENGIFERVVALDADTGEAVSAYATASLSATITPASNQIILGETGRAGDTTHRIVAYNWLDWDGD
jgi:outer membrane protein assembly factor BamB